MRVSLAKSPTLTLRLTFFAALMAILHPALAEVRSGKIIGDETTVGLPCEGCEAVFQGLPAQLGASGEIAPQSEPGERMTLSGTVRDQQNQPQANIVIYAYQTNQAGVYPRDPTLVGAAARHGRLRAWVRTDADGRYRFQTIRPGSYPKQNIAQHIHMHIIEPNRCTYYVDDLTFSDDMKQISVAPPQSSRRGGSGRVTPKKMADQSWQVTRDIVLGQAIAGYAQCAGAP